MVCFKANFHLQDKKVISILTFSMDRFRMVVPSITNAKKKLLQSFIFRIWAPQTTIRAEKMVDGDVITTSDTHAHRVHDISHKLLNTKWQRLRSWFRDFHYLMTSFNKSDQNQLKNTFECNFILYLSAGPVIRLCSVSPLNPYCNVIGLQYIHHICLFCRQSLTAV